jgi:hypothetical protein
VTYEELINDAREARELGDADLEISILEKAEALKSNPQESRASQLWKGIQRSGEKFAVGLAQRGTDLLSLPISATGEPLTRVKGREELQGRAKRIKESGKNVTGWETAGEMLGDVAGFAVMPGGPIVGGMLGGALAPSESPEETALNTGLAGIGGFAGQKIGQGLGYLFSKYRPTDPAKAALFQWAEQNNIPLTAGQMRSTPGAPNATILQRVEKQLAGLPGSSGFYSKNATAAQKGVNEKINALIGGNVDDLYNQVGRGRSVTIDNALLADLSGIPKKFDLVPVPDKPGSALRTIKDMTGGKIRNPALSSPDPAVYQAAKATPNVPLSGRFKLGDTIPLTGGRGDMNNINAMRSYYGQKAYDTPDTIDKFAYERIQRALDEAAERSNPDIAGKLKDVRGSYQIERMLASAKKGDQYDPKAVAKIVRRIQSTHPGQLERISGGRGEELKKLSELSDYLTYANSSGTAENQLVRDLLTGGLLGGSTYLATGDPKTAATATLGLYALPWLVNRAIQANARGLLGGALDIQNPTIANLLKRSAGAIPAAGLLSVTQ